MPTPRIRNKSAGRPTRQTYTFSPQSLSFTSPKNNKILAFYYKSCQRHVVDPNPNAAIAFSTFTPYLLAKEVNFELKHMLPICETLAAFRTETSIQHLSFRDCHLGSMCVPALAACLKENQTVRTLELQGNLINDDVAGAVADIIVSALSLEHLNMDANGITRSVAAILSEAVLKNGGNTTNLMSIEMTNNYLRQAGVDLLTSAGKETGIDIMLETGNFLVEEVWNSITHGVGSAASVTMLILLLRDASHCGADSKTWWSIMIYSIAQLTMFMCSTLYHSFGCCVAPRCNVVFGVLDHTAIYLLIAGTYTPYLMASPLYSQHQEVAIAAMIGVWTLAAIGIWLDLSFEDESKHKHLHCYHSSSSLTLAVGKKQTTTICGINSAMARTLGLIIYLVQGWFVIFFRPWLFPLLTDYSINLMGLGGLAYTGGVYFFKRGEVEAKYHVVWHMFVILGALIFYFSIQDMLFGVDGVHNVCLWED